MQKLAWLVFMIGSFAAGQTVTVTASHLQNASGQLISGYVYLQPTLTSGQPTWYRAPGGGTVSSAAVPVSVVNGVLSVTLPDTTQTYPANLCFTMTYPQGSLATGYNCLQPHTTAYNSSDWCQAGVCNLDNYLPGNQPLPTINAVSSINYTAGNLTFTGPGFSQSGNTFTFNGGAVQSLTTTGVSGASTLASGILNIPQYAGSGANSNITSLTGLTTPLSIAQGGTGQTSLVPTTPVTTAPSGSCAQGAPNQQVISTGIQYSCQNVVSGVGTWGTYYPGVSSDGANGLTVVGNVEAATVGGANLPYSYTVSISGTIVTGVNNSTGAIISTGTDAAVVVNAILTNGAAHGGTIFFRNGVYPLNSLTLTTIGSSNYYCAICIPSNPDTDWVQWHFLGESRTPWNWYNASNSEAESLNLLTTGVIFNVTATAVASVSSSDMIMGIFQQPDATTSVNNEDSFTNLDVRFPSNQRGNETGVAMWFVSAVNYDNVLADFAESPYDMATSAAPVPGSLGLYGLTGNGGGSGLPNTFRRSEVMGYDIGYDWGEHTVADADGAVFCNYPWKMGSSPFNGGSGGIYHNSLITKFTDQENLNGPVFGPNMEAGSRVDLIGYDIELGQGAYWFATRTAGDFVETIPGNSYGTVTYEMVQANQGAVKGNLFTSGGQNFSSVSYSNGKQYATILGTISSGAQLCAAGNGSLVACFTGRWKTQEGSGTTTADTSGNGANLALTSVTWSGALSPLTNALTFNGTSSTATTSVVTPFEFSYTSPFSVVIWVATTSTAAFNPLIGNNYGTTYDGWGLRLQTSSDSLEHPDFFFSSDYTTSNYLEVKGGASCYIPSTGAMHQLAMVYGGSGGASVSFYIDGSLCASSVLHNALTSDPAYDSPSFNVGAQLASTTGYFTGTLGDIGVYSYALTAAQVSAMYSSPYAY